MEQRSERQPVGNVSEAPNHRSDRGPTLSDP
jgi:hypothetical protein